MAEPGSQKHLKEQNEKQKYAGELSAEKRRKRDGKIEELRAWVTLLAAVLSALGTVGLLLNELLKG